MRILIAEDDLVNRKYLCSFLSKYGDCDVTVDGREAVEAFEMALEDGNPYDLVCLDIMMPNMNGFQALESIREMEKANGIQKKDATKILIMTALQDGSKAAAAYDLGCDAFCRKPVLKDNFEKAMKAMGLIYDGK